VYSGSLPYDLKGNRGLNAAISGYNNGQFPRGLARTTMTTEVTNLYNEKLKQKCDLMIALKAQMNGSGMSRRYLSIQHDCWSTRYGSGFLGIVVSFIFVTPNGSWVWSRITLGCIPFEKSHTAEHTLELALQVFQQFNFSEDDVMSSTQDNASAAFEVFTSIDDLSQLPCCAHTSQLFIKHACEKTLPLKESFDTVNELMVILKGSNSKKRKDELERCCGLVYPEPIIPLKPVMNSATRWNMREMQSKRCIYLHPAIELFDETVIDVKSKDNDGKDDGDDIADEI
jgi:hypothetical protein